MKMDSGGKYRKRRRRKTDSDKLQTEEDEQRRREVEAGDEKSEREQVETMWNRRIYENWVIGKWGELSMSVVHTWICLSFVEVSWRKAGWRKSYTQRKYKKMKTYHCFLEQGKCSSVARGRPNGRNMLVTAKRKSTVDQFVALWFGCRSCDRNLLRRPRRQRPPSTWWLDLVFLLLQCFPHAGM